MTESLAVAVLLVYSFLRLPGKYQDSTGENKNCCQVSPRNKLSKQESQKNQMHKCWDFDLFGIILFVYDASP